MQVGDGRCAHYLWNGIPYTTQEQVEVLRPARYQQKLG